MSDNEIREILIEKKKLIRRHERMHHIKDVVEGFIGFASLIVIFYMIAIIGG